MLWLPDICFTFQTFLCTEIVIEIDYDKYHHHRIHGAAYYSCLRFDYSIRTCPSVLGAPLYRYCSQDWVPCVTWCGSLFSIAFWDKLWKVRHRWQNIRPVPVVCESMTRVYGWIKLHTHTFYINVYIVLHMYTYIPSISLYSQERFWNGVKFVFCVWYVLIKCMQKWLIYFYIRRHAEWYVYTV